MWLVGVVVRRYIDFLILLIPTPLVSALFAAFCSFLKMFLFLYIIIEVSTMHAYHDHFYTPFVHCKASTS